MIAVFVVIVVVLMAANATQGVTTEATSTESWVKALDLYTSDWTQMLFIVNNTGVTNTLAYKVHGYAVYGGTGYEVYKDSTVVSASAGSTPVKIANTAYSNVEVWVISGSGATTYTVEYTLKP